MKKHICWVLLCVALPCMIVLCGSNKALAQTANCENCKTQKYNYNGCDETTGRTKILCTDNPLAEANFRPWKKCLPIGIDFDTFPTDNLGFNYLYYTDDNGEKVTIFDVESAENAGWSALLEWEHLCTPIADPRCDSCRVVVKWIRDAKEFHGDPSLTWGYCYQEPSLAGYCNSDCGRGQIEINLIPEFIQQNEQTKYPQVFYYTNRNIEAQFKDSSRDFRSLIEHEIGHWLGFHHSVACNVQANYARGIMDGGGLGVGERGERGEYNLNFHDKCMFMKLYCCPAIVGVEEEKSDDYQQVGELKVFPNPATQSISFELPPSYIGSSLHIRLCSLIGDVVAEYHLQAASPRQSLPLPPIAAGSYYIILSSNRGERSRGMVVIGR